MTTARRPAAGRVPVLERTMDRSCKLVRSLTLQPARSGAVGADDMGRVLWLQPRKPRARVPRRISLDHQPHELIEST